MMHLFDTTNCPILTIPSSIFFENDAFDKITLKGLSGTCKTLRATVMSTVRCVNLKNRLFTNRSLRECVDSLNDCGVKYGLSVSELRLRDCEMQENTDLSELNGLCITGGSRSSSIPKSRDLAASPAKADSNASNVSTHPISQTFLRARFTYRRRSRMPRLLNSSFTISGRRTEHATSILLGLS